MPNFHLNRALAALAGALLLVPRLAGSIGNAPARNLRSRGGLLLFGALLAVSQFFFFARVADAQFSNTDIRVDTTTFNEHVGQAVMNVTNRFNGVRSFTFNVNTGTATSSANAAVAGQDFTRLHQDFLTGIAFGNSALISIRITDDDINEGQETFHLTMRITGAGITGTLTYNVPITITDNDPPGVTVTPSVVSEGQTAEFTVALNAGSHLITPEDPHFVFSTEDGTATAGQDYTEATGGGIGQSLASGSNTFSIDIADDTVSDDGETFTIVIDAPQPPGTGAGSIASLRHVVTIREGPVTPPPPGPNRPDPAGSDAILAENSNHLIAQSEAILAAQPRLTDYARNTGIAASDFTLRASNGGLEALDGGFAGEGFWGEATFSRSGSRGADGKHVVASLGTHRQLSDSIYLGGMLQFDRTVTNLDGGGRSGEFAGEGWLAGPYVVARDPSRSLFFEGRLLYGTASHDADAVDSGDGPKDGSFDSERWVAQARVEGEYPLGAGIIMYPLADLSHARNAGNGFDETPDDQGNETDLDVALRTAVSKLQLGAEFEMPLDPARGDLILRPGLKLEVSDRKGVAFGKSEDLDTTGRVDLGIDYRLETGIALGFQGYYSGIGGGSEFENYGAGLRLRMEF